MAVAGAVTFQPQQVAPVPMQMMTQMSMPSFSQPQREWDTGLFDCLEDIYSCLMGTFAPCLLEGNIVQLISSRGTNAWGCDCAIGCITYSCLAACAPFACLCCYTAGKRTQIRAIHNLKTTTCGDFCLHFWCLPCAQCQEYRQLLRPIQVPILMAPTAAPAATTIVINNSNSNSNNVNNSAQLNNNNNIGVGGGDNPPHSPNQGQDQNGGFGSPPPMGNYNPAGGYNNQAPGNYNNQPPTNYNPQYAPQGCAPQLQQQQYGGYQQQPPQMSPGAQQPMGGPPGFAPQNYMLPSPPVSPTNQQMSPPGYPPAQQWGQTPQAHVTPQPETDPSHQQTEAHWISTGGPPPPQISHQPVGTAPTREEQE